MARAVQSEETLLDWTERLAAEVPDRIAVSIGDERITYAELYWRSSSLAAFFHELGIGRGDVVAVQLPNGIEFLLTYLATGFVGAVLQTLHMPYRAAELELLLRHCGAKAFICLAETKDFAPAQFGLLLRERLPALAHVIAVGESAPAGAIEFPKRFQREMPKLQRPVSSDRFLLLYTSGTSAAPKGVPVPYRNYLGNARASAPELEVDAASAVMTLAPFTHLYGLFSINLALAAGARIAILPAFTAQSLAAALPAQRPTVLMTAPAHMAAMLQAGLLTAELLASVALLQISGSVCPPELARQVQALMPNGEVHQLWGMSELQAGAFTRPGEPAELRLGFAGRASPCTSLRIAEEDSALPPGTEGELQVKGISVFSGYLDDAAASAAAFTSDGWFRSGDLAVMHAAGHIRITGRIKELINRGGVKLNPVDIEAVLARHRGVAQCAIVPMPDQRLGEIACCFLVPRDASAAPSLADLLAFLAEEGIAKTRWPEHLEIVAELPMTPTRKVKKGELTKLAAALRTQS
jgi:cyclohexanecarboxylate-CoA ligase/acyl-CoA synthetase